MPTTILTTRKKKGSFVVVAIEALGILVFAQQPTFQKEVFSRIQNASQNASKQQQ
jgi:hypothetical protein